MCPTCPVPLVVVLISFFISFFISLTLCFSLLSRCFALFFRGQRANLLRVNAEAEAKGDVETPLTKLHVHFGCGRLGMGLLSPAMAEANRPVILIDGPFGDYEKLVKEGHKTVNFYVNGEVRGLAAGPEIVLFCLQARGYKDLHTHPRDDGDAIFFISNACLCVVHALLSAFLLQDVQKVHHRS